MIGARIFKTVVLYFFLFSLLFVANNSFSQDIKGLCDPPPYDSQPEIFSTINGNGETVWHLDVNSACNFNDHNIYLGVDVDPSEISDAKIILTAWDVDYNSTACSGGPEVDYLYVNGNYVGQLTGANNSWNTNTFTIQSSYLVNGSNHIWVETDAPGTGCWCVGVGYVEVTGKVGFQVTKHIPDSDATNLSWDEPITIEFSGPVKDSTVDDTTVILEYRNQAGNYVAVNTKMTLDSSTIVKIKPVRFWGLFGDDLMDGIRYRVRVLNGPNGVLSSNDTELAETVTWFFWTMVDLDGNTTKVYPPNTTKDKMQITWFNTVRNADLVPGKDVVNRIYTLWDPKDNVFDDDEVIEFKANITFSHDGTSRAINNVTIKRQDKYTANEKKNASNTINFEHVGGGGSQEKYELNITPSPQVGTVKTFTKSEDATVKSSVEGLSFDVWTCEMAGWFNGVNSAEEAVAKNTLSSGATYTEQTFPVSSCTYNEKGTIVPGRGGFNMTEVNNGVPRYSSWWDDNTIQGDGGMCEEMRFVEIPFLKFWTKEIEEAKHVMNHLASLKPAKDDFIVGIAPDDAIPCANGLHMGHVILFSESNFNASTVAHEIGHDYGLYPTGVFSIGHNDDPDDIEGFRVATSSNKSHIEGNSEGASVLPLMHTFGQKVNRRWIRSDSYNHLLGKLATSSVKNAMALTGNYFVIQGYTDKNGNIDNILPIYRVVQRHMAAPSGADYLLEMYTGENGTGSSLGNYQFNTERISISRTSGATHLIDSHMFAFTIPYDDTVQSLVLTSPSTSMTLNISDNGAAPPVASFKYPLDGALLSGIVNLNWDGLDDGGTVYYRLEYSPDGVWWIPVSNQMMDVTNYNLDTTLLPTGSGQRLALIAYDGFQSIREEINVTINNFVNVKSTMPLDGDINISEWQKIAAYFVSDMDKGSIDETTILLFENGMLVPGTVGYEGTGRKATFTPNSKLKSNTTYTARLVVNGVHDTTGNSLATNFEWSFTTGLTPINPQVISATPKHGSNDVALNAIIQADFEKDIDPTTVSTSAIIVEDENTNVVTGTVHYNTSSKSIVFIPSTNLNPNETYNVTLLSAVIADANGLPLETEYSWSFTTGTNQATGVNILGIARDEALDSDSDKLFDKLVATIQVEIMSVGTYNISCQLQDSSGEDIDWKSLQMSFSSPGVYLMDIEFDGTAIGSHGIDGPFQVVNIAIYSTSNSSLYDSYTGSYQTNYYEADSFYSVIRLTGIPNIAVGFDSSENDIVLLEDYTSHLTYNVSDLAYSIFVNTDPRVGVSFDTTNFLDINPGPGFEGFSDITAQTQDQNGKRAVDTFRVSVLDGFRFPAAGWYLISLPYHPEHNDISTVLQSISGKYGNIWAFTDNAWKLYNPTSPGFSDLMTMETGYGYWIEILTPADLVITGSSVAGANISLHSSWNLVGYNAAQALTSADAFSSIAGRYHSVWAFIDGAWQVYDPNNSNMSDLKEVKQGYGYWINALMDTTWIVR